VGRQGYLIVAERLWSAVACYRFWSGSLLPSHAAPPPDEWLPLRARAWVPSDFASCLGKAAASRSHSKVAPRQSNDPAWTEELTGEVRYFMVVFLLVPAGADSRDSGSQTRRSGPEGAVKVLQPVLWRGGEKLEGGAAGRWRVRLRRWIGRGAEGEFCGAAGG
jgi:hypothetical protein